MSMEEVWNRIIENQATVRYQQAKFFSPYCESVAGSISRLNDGNDLITINSFYRFNDIFLSLFELDNIKNETREWLLDCMMHLLTRLELRGGVNSQEYQVRNKWKEIEKNNYGFKLRMLFEQLTEHKKYMASWFMVQQEKTGGNITLFAKALIGIIQDGVLYKNNEDLKELILYIGREENEQILNEIEFVKEAYMPFDYRLRIFWNHSFGIVDDDRCMQIGNIEIY